MARPAIYTPEETALRRKDSFRKYRISPKRAEALRRYNEAHAEENAIRKRAWFLKNPGYMASYYGDKTNRLRILLNAAKTRAKKAGVPFDITPDDLDIPDVCPVLGIPVSLAGGNGPFDPNSPSLDRLIPALGYVRGNVCVISYRANRIKNDASLAELEAIVAYMKREVG